MAFLNLLSVLFACECVGAFAGFVFSPVHKAPPTHAHVAEDVNSKGQAMAQELEGVQP